ncbi:MAG: hypothetical protein IJU45_05685 [Clostridia bacterium]|nr:hypothetical protein [Clostridia bacterium]
MKKSVKRILTAAVVIAAMFCFGLVAFAADGEKTFWDIIAANPVASSAVKEILLQFVQAIGETLMRYVAYIIELVGQSGVVA